ncbi:MAG: hypothetical protein QXS76_01785 [Candidatus Bathyarchaeia archaeon]
MVRRVYVDTAWNSKPHTCYDPVEDRFFEVEDLAELAEKYDEIYVDSSIFPRMWDQLRALIDDGARVFHFAWPWKWKKLREKYVEELRKRFGKEKTDFGDAYILSRICDEVPKAFREVTPLDAVFKPLLIKERALARQLMRLQQMLELGIDFEDEIRDCEERLRNVRGEIVKNAVEKIPRFTEIAEKLGLNNNNINALSALTGLLIHLKWPYNVPSYHKAMRFLGLYKPTKDDKRKYEERSGEKYVRRYSRHARGYLTSLTAAILVKKRILKPRMRHQREVLRRLLSILRTYSDGADADRGAG